LVVAYFRQETLDPIKSLGRFILFGIVGALLFALGGGMAALAGIRAIQSETGRHLFGSLTWIPYFGGFFVAGVGAGWALLRISRATRSNPGKTAGGGSP
jgi:hypothetical protein